MTNALMNTYSPRSLLRINKEEWTEQDIYQLQKVIERFGNNRTQVYEFFSNKSEQQFEAAFRKYSKTKRRQMTNVDDDVDDNDDISISDSDSDSDSNNIEDGISDYEQLRLERMKRNQEMLQKLGLDKFAIKRVKEIDTFASTTRRSQPGRSTKKKVQNKVPKQQIRTKENTVVLPIRRSNRIQENRHDLQSTITHRRETAVEFDIAAGIMDDIAELLIDLDDDSYIDEEDEGNEGNEEDLYDDLNNDKDKDSDNNITPQKLKKVRVQIEELFRTEEPVTSDEDLLYLDIGNRLSNHSHI